MKHGTDYVRGVPVRAVQSRVGAPDEGRGAARVPQVQEPILEHAAPERATPAPTAHPETKGDLAIIYRRIQ